MKKKKSPAGIGAKIVIFIFLLIIGCILVLMRITVDGGIYFSSVQNPVAETVTPSLSVQPTASPSPTPSPTPTPTPEPTPEYFTISAVGDLTLASHQHLGDASPYSYASRMNGDYTYPFQNVIGYFDSDDLTIANLECTLSDNSLYSNQTFYFRSPAAWANILTENSIDFVTTANNHSWDFSTQGIEDTAAALDAVGEAHAGEGESYIYTTPSGLVVGIYCAYNNYQPDINQACTAIQALRENGAEYVICMYHWGEEIHYHPNAYQQELAHACIDAGANLIYGSHSHCLQPVEEYNGGIILYSMGNFSFGGNTSPTDWDTAIVQVSVKRDLDGTISNDSWSAIPCRCSESTDINDYKPTPYEVDSDDYNRAMSKLLGTYEGADQNIDYTDWDASYTG